MTTIYGGCHCGNIRYQFVRPDFDPNSDNALPVRACTCSFCIKHGGVYTSHPEGTLTAQIEDEARIQRYAFGTETAQFYICKECGVFPFVTSMLDGKTYAVVNVNTFENVTPSALVPSTADFEGEIVEDRLARRQRTWTPEIKITYL
ncbi:MAG: hypothetical protein AAF702_28845 [Chloroflexota bacterium]